MRFDLPESITAMREGRKTQTRRRNVQFWLKKKRGDRITIVHKGEYLGWARVSRIWRERLGDMADDDAACEGYEDADAFWDAWERLYGEFNADEEVIAISFYDIHWSEA